MLLFKFFVIVIIVFTDINIKNLLQTLIERVSEISWTKPKRKSIFRITSAIMTIARRRFTPATALVVILEMEGVVEGTFYWFSIFCKVGKKNGITNYYLRFICN